jgi:hypothetical protein
LVGLIGVGDQGAIVAPVGQAVVIVVRVDVVAGTLSVRVDDHQRKDRWAVCAPERTSVLRISTAAVHRLPKPQGDGRTVLSLALMELTGRLAALIRPPASRLHSRPISRQGRVDFLSLRACRIAP